MDHIRTVFDSLFTISIFDVLNNFIKNLLNVKSSDCIDLLSKLHTSRAYSKVGKHFCFCYILPANQYQQRANTNKKEWQKVHFKTNKTPNEITICLQRHESRDCRCSLRSFRPIPKNESALAEANRLVKDRSRKSEAIQERSLSDLNSPLVDRGFSWSATCSEWVVRLELSLGALQTQVDVVDDVFPLPVSAADSSGN